MAAFSGQQSAHRLDYNLLDLCLSAQILLAKNHSTSIYKCVKTMQFPACTSALIYERKCRQTIKKVGKKKVEVNENA